MDTNMKKIRLSLLAFAIGLLISGCGGRELNTDTGNTTSAAANLSETIDVAANLSETIDVTAGADKTIADMSGTTRVAAGAETVSPIDVVEEGKEPVFGTKIKDGVYSVAVDSSSNMFQITACELTVKDGAMRAVMTMSGTGYLKLYMGIGKDALNADEKDYIPYVQTARGTHTFEVPVAALDMGLNCSAFSKNKEKWYDRVLVFRSDSLPIDAFAAGAVTTADSLNLEDGMYTADVILEGGSGRAFVESPASIRVEDGNVLATVIWGSSHYNYMKVDGEKYEWAGTDGNSTFVIPLRAFDWKIPVIANTIAMSEPHEINYTLTFDSTTLKKAE